MIAVRQLRTPAMRDGRPHLRAWPCQCESAHRFAAHSPGARSRRAFHEVNNPGSKTEVSEKHDLRSLTGGHSLACSRLRVALHLDEVTAVHPLLSVKTIQEQVRNTRVFE